jgi:hypothetical protein
MNLEIVILFKRKCTLIHYKTLYTDTVIGFKYIKMIVYIHVQLYVKLENEMLKRGMMSKANRTEFYAGWKI